MRILVYRPDCTRAVHQDVELLKARGYDVRSLCDLTGEYGQAGVITVLRMMAFELLSKSGGIDALVLHPSTKRTDRRDLVGLCRIVCKPAFRMEDLPAVVPSSVVAIEDLDLRWKYAPYATRVKRMLNNTSRNWRELVRGIPHLLRRWEARVNAWLGHCLKNAATRRQPDPKPYKLNTRVSTTG